MASRGSRRMRWCATVLLLATCLAGSRSAKAAANARLFYGVGSGVEGCPDEAGLRHAIADRVGYDPVFPIAPNDVAVAISRAGDRLVGDVKFVDRGRTIVGGRTFQARVGQCDELVATIALSVAIALDQFEKASAAAAPVDAPLPEANPSSGPTASSTPPSTAPPPDPAPATSAPSAADTPPDRPTAAPPSLRFELAGGIAGWIGTAPSFSFGPTLSAAARWRRLALGIEGRMELPSGGAVSGLPVGEVRTSLAGAGPTACLAFDPYFACGVAFVGALHADAPGVPGAGTRSSVDVLAGGRAGAAIALGLGLSVRVSLDLLAQAYGPTVRAAGIDWRPSPVAGGAQAALAWQIP